MQLCDKDIYRAMIMGDLLIVGTNVKYPFIKETQVQPASVDLRLGNRIMRFRDDIESFDINNIKEISKELVTTYVDDGQQIVINPNEVLFCQIYEQIAIPNYLSARIEGRSRVARLGVSIHCTGDYINPGFAGAMPLQIINHNRFPIVLYPYIGICQMILYRLSDEPLVSYLQRSGLPYNTYYNETNPSPSILSSNAHEAPADNNIVELRIQNLIENYYRTITKELEAHTIDSQTEEILHGVSQHLINDATRQNYQNLINVHGGTINMGDQYNAKQAGIQGKNAGENATVTQIYNEASIKDEDVTLLIDELDKVRKHIKANFDDEEHDVVLGDVSNATMELKKNNKTGALGFLKKGGKVLYDVATTAGATLLAYYLGKILGLA